MMDRRTVSVTAEVVTVEARRRIPTTNGVYLDLADCSQILSSETIAAVTPRRSAEQAATTRVVVVVVVVVVAAAAVAKLKRRVLAKAREKWQVARQWEIQVYATRIKYMA